MGSGRRGPPGTLDWDEIRRRVEDAGRAISGRESPSAEQVRELLEERARTLARPLAPDSTEEMVEVITFTVSGEAYAIESRYVVEIFRLEHLAVLPGAEPPLMGVTAWRGELLTVLDLRRMTGGPAHALSDLDRVIVLGEDAPAFGILADAVEDVTMLAASGIHPPPEGVAAKREFVCGVTREALLVLEAGELIRSYT